MSEIRISDMSEVDLMYAVGRGGPAAETFRAELNRRRQARADAFNEHTRRYGLFGRASSMEV